MVAEDVGLEGYLAGGDGQYKEEDQEEKLFGAGGRAGPVPSETIPPESGGNLEAEAISGSEQASTSQGHIGALAGAAFQAFGQTKRLKQSSATARARIRLRGADYLLSEGQILVGRVEHQVASPTILEDLQFSRPAAQRQATVLHHRHWHHQEV